MPAGRGTLAVTCAFCYNAYHRTNKQQRSPRCWASHAIISPNENTCSLGKKITPSGAKTAEVRRSSETELDEFYLTIEWVRELEEDVERERESGWRSDGGCLNIKAAWYLYMYIFGCIDICKNCIFQTVCKISNMKSAHWENEQFWCLNIHWISIAAKSMSKRSIHLS